MIRRWLNRTFYCPFWGCQPPEDGTWWRAKNGMVVITPETKMHCGKCGGDL